MTDRTPVGEIRPSQLLWTYGPGALIDLPSLSVITLGTDRWEKERCLPIEEARLLSAVRRVLGPQVDSLRMPPLRKSENGGRRTRTGGIRSRRSREMEGRAISTSSTIRRRTSTMRRACRFLRLEPRTGCPLIAEIHAPSPRPVPRLSVVRLIPGLVLPQVSRQRSFRSETAQRPSGT